MTPLPLESQNFETLDLKLEEQVESVQKEFSEYQQSVDDDKAGQKSRLKAGLKKYAAKKHKEISKKLKSAETNLEDHQKRHWGTMFYSSAKFSQEKKNQITLVLQFLITTA